MRYNKLIQQKSFLFIVSALFSFSATSQEERSMPKNNMGVFAGIEWNTISGGWGLEYERLFSVHSRLVAGAKATHVFRYKYENLKLVNAGQCCETVSHSQILATGYYFTSETRSHSGFFLHAGLGASYSRLEYDGDNINYPITKVKPAVDLGLGLQFYISDKMTIRWTNIASYGPYKGAFTSTRFSLGF